MSNRHSRRRFLAAVGVSAVSALAGCSDDDDRRGPGMGDDDRHHNGPGGTDSIDDGRHHHDDTVGDRRLGPVPAVYENARALDGTVRDPDSLSSKRGVNYQSVPEGGRQCAGCGYYIPDKDGDGLGACAIVAGRIEPDGWCVSYVSY
ncbi:MAG: high-potential iron-sulfur protein [Halovenus sp.]|uniref:high-potential iron-sulfur protein n=1 Tax=Halovenus amylolytica TaxID=2500550 RepID=UPI000FE42058